MGRVCLPWSKFSMLFVYSFNSFFPFLCAPSLLLWRLLVVIFSLLFSFSVLLSILFSVCFPPLYVIAKKRRRQTKPSLR